MEHSKYRQMLPNDVPIFLSMFVIIIYSITRRSIPFNSKWDFCVCQIYFQIDSIKKNIFLLIISKILAQELGPATNLSALVNVVAYINDLNDNPPVFERDMYIVEIPENITAGRKVTQVW